MLPPASNSARVCTTSRPCTPPSCRCNSVRLNPVCACAMRRAQMVVKARAAAATIRVAFIFAPPLPRRSGDATRNGTLAGKDCQMNRPRRLPIAILFATSAAFAQTPAPKTQATAPAQSTYTIPIGSPIALDAAKKAAAAASAEARKNAWFMAIAVVDPAGTLVYYEKADNTQIGSARVAIDKARSAALYKRPTKAFQDNVEKGGAGLRVFRLEGAIPVDGGLPLLV